MMCWQPMQLVKQNMLVSVAGCLGYDVLVYLKFEQLGRHRFQLLVV
jgi:hypothetical protein